jgi:AraC family transcriptional regulator, transcriptional activator of pobA
MRKPRTKVLDRATHSCTVQESQFRGRPTKAPGWMVDLESLTAQHSRQGWVTRPHLHFDFAQFVIVRSGGGKVTFEGSSPTFGDKTILFVPAQTVHGFAYRRGARGSVLTIAVRYLQEFTARHPELGRAFNNHLAIGFKAHGQQFEEIADLLGEIGSELKNTALGRAMATEGLLLRIFALIVRQIQITNPVVLTVPQIVSSPLKRFVDLVDRHYGDEWSLAQYAKELNTTQARLRAWCAAADHGSPIEIIHNRIVLEAKRHLRYTNASIASIAYRLGFTDPAYFTRFFRQRASQAPTQYRQQELDGWDAAAGLKPVASSTVSRVPRA